MAEHVVPLSDPQESTLQREALSQNREADTLIQEVIERWLRDRAQVHLDEDQRTAFQAYQAADPAVQAQVRVLLGLEAPPESQKKNFQGV